MNDIFLVWAGLAWLAGVGAFTLVDKKRQHWGAWLTGAVVLVAGLYLNWERILGWF